jgi:pSer/pThr/pTyr-binding forkhead associated (FHA) protein
LPSGQRISLGDRPVTIGRQGDCTIPLNDQNVSRRHAQIVPGRGAYLVADLGSTNGTMVNGKLAKEHRLKDGDTIGFGSSDLQFRLGG